MEQRLMMLTLIGGLPESSARSKIREDVVLVGPSQPLPPWNHFMLNIKLKIEEVLQSSCLSSNWWIAQQLLMVIKDAMEDFPAWPLTTFSNTALRLKMIIPTKPKTYNARKTQASPFTNQTDTNYWSRLMSRDWLSSSKKALWVWESRSRGTSRLTLEEFINLRILIAGQIWTMLCFWLDRKITTTLWRTAGVKSGENKGMWGWRLELEAEVAE